VVREDPVRKGLLYAGTEGSVYVSFNDGDDWQPLQLNLPHTSMRDLAIHGDDLIVATHGRSFWILDDLTPLRQMNAEIAKESAHLFEPQEATRFRWNRNPDTPLPPEFPAGKNPPDGAIIDYYLAAAAGKSVTLEILNDQQQLVRRYASTDKSDLLEKSQLNIPFRCIGFARRRFFPRARGCTVLSGTCTARRRILWGMSFQFPQSFKTLPNIRWERGHFPASTQRN